MDELVITDDSDFIVNERIRCSSHFEFKWSLNETTYKKKTFWKKTKTCLSIFFCIKLKKEITFFIIFRDESFNGWGLDRKTALSSQRSQILIIWKINFGIEASTILEQSCRESTLMVTVLMLLNLLKGVMVILKFIKINEFLDHSKLKWFLTRSNLSVYDCSENCVKDCPKFNYIVGPEHKFWSICMVTIL